jgi:hypothetical protein
VALGVGSHWLRSILFYILGEYEAILTWGYKVRHDPHIWCAASGFACKSHLFFRIELLFFWDAQNLGGA